jgi:hypothetical protein
MSAVAEGFDGQTSVKVMAHHGHQHRATVVRRQHASGLLLPGGGGPLSAANVSETLYVWVVHVLCHSRLALPSSEMTRQMTDESLPPNHFVFLL